MAHDEFWNLHPTKEKSIAAKVIISRIGIFIFQNCLKLEYYSYEMMNTCESVMEAFEICASEHLNNLMRYGGRIYKKACPFLNFQMHWKEWFSPFTSRRKTAGFKIGFTQGIMEFEPGFLRCNEKKGEILCQLYTSPASPP